MTKPKPKAKAKKATKKVEKSLPPGTIRNLTIRGQKGGIVQPKHAWKTKDGKRELTVHVLEAPPPTEAQIMLAQLAALRKGLAQVVEEMERTEKA